MTVATRHEAEFAARYYTALKLAKAKLFNLEGGEHICPLDDSAFSVIQESGS